MSGHQRELMAYDASHFGYMSVIEDAARTAGWGVVPYDNEKYVIEDLEYLTAPTLVAVLDDFSYAYEYYEGRSLLDLALTRKVPTAVIALENMQTRLAIAEPNIFIPRVPGEMVNPLASWLITLSRTT